jgi:prepilin-type processing-associated H-X9-DG protein
MQAEDQAQHNLPKETDNSYFVCPSASEAVVNALGDVVEDGYYKMWGWPVGTDPYAPTGAADQRKVYWCYVINSKLDNNSPGASTSSHPFLKISMLRKSTEIPLLVEKLMRGAETTPSYTDTLMRGKTTYTRFAGRHRGGGYLLFVDGHVGFFTRAELLSFPLTAIDGNIPGKVIWNPFVQ